MWLRIGYKGALPPVTSAGKGNKGKVGQVGPHGTQGTRGYSGADTRPEKDRLESEHIIPRDWALAFVQGYYEAIKLRSPEDKSLYDKMTTVMLYKGAADRKTEKDKLADNVVRTKLRHLVAGHPDAKDPDAVAKSVHANFDGPLASRIKITKWARDEERKANGRRGTKVPSDAVIEGAALRQLLDIISFLRDAITASAAKRRR